jgi:DNA-binding NarL/FixJ family response regulator
LKCLEEIKKVKKLNEVSVFLYSTHISSETLNKALQFGAAGCIKKSDTVAELCKILRQVFSSDDQLSYS